MNINKVKENTTLTVEIIGRVDTTTAPVLEKELKGSYDGITELKFDFAQVEYISSAGLRVLLLAQKAMSTRGSVKIIHVSSSIMEIFEVTGFTEILEIE